MSKCLVLYKRQSFYTCTVSKMMQNQSVAGLTCINVVERIGDSCQLLKEVIGVNVFSFCTNTVHLCINVDRTIHLSHRCRSRCRLGFLHTSVTSLFIILLHCIFLFILTSFHCTFSSIIFIIFLFYYRVYLNLIY